MASIDELERRIVAVEREVSALRSLLMPPRPEETRAERGARLRREAELGQAAFEAGWNTAMEKIGVHGVPIGVQGLREMIAACGFKPEDNAFSRGIIEMREE
jgi:hypothetical protein